MARAGADRVPHQAVTGRREVVDGRITPARTFSGVSRHRRVVDGDGEWEAWFFAAWMPGARRYRSFHDMIQVGAYYDGAIYLLNPRVVTHEGEWEGLFMTGWLPGVSRYRSFGEMMQAALESYVRIKGERAGESEEET